MQTRLTPSDKALRVRAMFARISARYDLLNRLMTFGLDRRWRRLAVEWAGLPPGSRVLDLGAGTGDLAFEALRRCSPRLVVAADFTPEMLLHGRARRHGREVRWMVTDALRLPFADESFDLVLSGFLMRNVTDLDRAWREQWRVLRAGGTVICLDTTPPSLAPVRWYLRVILPLLGRLAAGDAQAYAYLGDSTQAFLPAEELAQRMSAAGFREVQYRRLAFGSVAIHRGRKGNVADMAGL